MKQWCRGLPTCSGIPSSLFSTPTFPKASLSSRLDTCPPLPRCYTGSHPNQGRVALPISLYTRILLPTTATSALKVSHIPPTSGDIRRTNIGFPPHRRGSRGAVILSHARMASSTWASPRSSRFLYSVAPQQNPMPRQQRHPSFCRTLCTYSTPQILHHHPRPVR